MDRNAARQAQGWGVGGKVEAFSQQTLPDGRTVRRRSRAPEPPEEGKEQRGVGRPVTAPAKAGRGKAVPALNLKGV